jgi:heme-degrading monooxygenase HmoA
MMSVKIIIERKFKEAPVQENFRIINELRRNAMRQKGYVSGETLVNSEDGREVVVLSTWSDLDDWKTWSSSQERSKLENELTPYLEEPANVRSFTLGADAIKEAFDKFVHDADAAS